MRTGLTRLRCGIVALFLVTVLGSCLASAQQAGTSQTAATLRIEATVVPMVFGANKTSSEQTPSQIASNVAFNISASKSVSSFAVIEDETDLSHVSVSVRGASALPNSGLLLTRTIVPR